MKVEPREARVRPQTMPECCCWQVCMRSSQSGCGRQSASKKLTTSTPSICASFNPVLRAPAGPQFSWSLITKHCAQSTPPAPHLSPRAGGTHVCACAHALAEACMGPFTFRRVRYGSTATGEQGEGGVASGRYRWAVQVGSPEQLH